MPLTQHPEIIRFVLTLFSIAYISRFMAVSRVFYLIGDAVITSKITTAITSAQLTYFAQRLTAHGHLVTGKGLTNGSIQMINHRNQVVYMVNTLNPPPPAIFPHTINMVHLSIREPDPVYGQFERIYFLTRARNAPPPPQLIQWEWVAYANHLMTLDFTLEIEPTNSTNHFISIFRNRIVVRGIFDDRVAGGVFAVVRFSFDLDNCRRYFPPSLINF